jgi:hypothetical protein
MRRTTYGILVLTATLLAGGCDNELENVPTTPEAPPTTTDTFTGSVNVNGASTHTFTVAASGTVSATLTELTPDPNIGVGFVMGVWNGASCQTSLSMDTAVQGNALTGNATGVGTLCVRVHDTGRLTGSVNYTLTVVHP